MSAIELSSRISASGAESRLSGWGRARASACEVLDPRSAEQVLDVLQDPRSTQHGVIARGAGRSYGDAAQLQGGRVLDMSAWKRIISIDPERMLVRAQAGATIAELMTRLSAYRLGLPVVPGTRYVTLAGAIASDIHGKNHHRDGAFARHVCEIVLCTPEEGLIELSPERDPDLFYATLGGMGLTGVILEATLRVEALPSPWVSEDTDRTSGLEQTLELMSASEHHRYSVAWLDLLAGGSRMGRAVLSRADPLEPPDAVRAVPSQRAGDYPAALNRPPLASVPQGFPAGLLRMSTIRAFNALYWRRAPRRERARPRALAPYFFPLDVLGDWNRLYGPGGLLQYQLVVPAGAEDTLVRCFELMRARRLPGYLAVFKRFGEAFGGPLSFPLKGWTLAVDFPARAPGLARALTELDELVAGCGGRVYLSKDVRLGREMLGAMYPRVSEFEAQRTRVDPQGVLRSDLGERVGICGASA